MNKILITLATSVSLITLAHAADLPDAGLGADYSMVDATRPDAWRDEWPTNVRGEPIIITIDLRGNVSRGFLSYPVDDVKIIRGEGWNDPTDYWSIELNRTYGD